MIHSIGDMVGHRYKTKPIFGIVVDIKEKKNDYQDDEFIVLWLNDCDKNNNIAPFN